MATAIETTTGVRPRTAVVRPRMMKQLGVSARDQQRFENAEPWHVASEAVADVRRGAATPPRLSRRSPSCGHPSCSGCGCCSPSLVILAEAAALASARICAASARSEGERSSRVSVCSIRCGFRRSQARRSRSCSSRSAARQRVVKP